MEGEEEREKQNRMDEWSISRDKQQSIISRPSDFVRVVSCCILSVCLLLQNLCESLLLFLCECLWELHFILDEQRKITTQRKDETM
jgi:hypothetical protein